MKLTNRFIEIIRDHVFYVRASWEPHILDARWPATTSGRKNGQRRLDDICGGKWLDKHVVHAKPVRRVRLLFAGGPNDAAPDFAALSRESRQGWKLPIRRLTIYTASNRARRIFGGVARHHVHALSALSHDLGVACVFYTFVRESAELARRWRSEDEMILPADFGDAQPDGVLVDECGRPETAVEFASDYEAQRFAKLWNTIVAEQKLRLQIYGAEP
jgi:hypothetical protein